MKKYKAIVNHNGACGSHTYQRNKETTLPEDVVNALGDSVRIVSEIKEEEKKIEEKPEKEEKKEVKNQLDRMVRKPDVVTK